MHLIPLQLEKWHLGLRLVHWLLVAPYCDPATRYAFIWYAYRDCRCASTFLNSACDTLLKDCERPQLASSAFFPLPWPKCVRRRPVDTGCRNVAASCNASADTANQKHRLGRGGPLHPTRFLSKPQGAWTKGKSKFSDLRSQYFLLRKKRKDK